MKTHFLTILIGLLLASCAKVVSPIPEKSSSPTLMPQPVVSLPGNLVLGKSAIASNYVTGEPPLNVVDGDTSSLWSAGGGPEQWIQIDLGTLVTVTAIRLFVSQAETGQSTHRILAGASADSLHLMHEFSGVTSDGQELTYTSPLPLANIRYVKILTTVSPSQVAWREIQVFGEIPVVSADLTPLPEADFIYYNGHILTMDPENPTAEAIAIKDDVILAVGSLDEILGFKSDSTQLMDLQGLTMTPGFIDSHEHRIGDRWQYGNPPLPQLFYNILSEGWTSVHEMWVDNARLNELIALDEAGQLPLRVSMYLKMNSEYSIDNWWQSYEPLTQFSPFLQIAGLKITLDREWGQLIFLDQTHLDTIVLDAYARGWQVATHSFSPAANAQILDAYANALDGRSNETIRLRIEHLGVMTDPQVARMAELGIIGSIQFITTGAAPDDPSFQTYIPLEFQPFSSRWRDLISAGAFLVGNTDAPWCCTDWRNSFTGPSYSPTVPMAIYQGVTRTTFTGRPPEAWQVAQVVTVQEALEMMTIRGAYAAHQENVIGSLTPGKFADLVILSGNPLTVSTGDLQTLKVVMTMVAGEVRYCLTGFDLTCTATVPP